MDSEERMGHDGMGRGQEVRDGGGDWLTVLQQRNKLAFSSTHLFIRITHLERDGGEGKL